MRTSRRYYRRQPELSMQDIASIDKLASIIGILFVLTSTAACLVAGVFHVKPF